MKAMNHIDEKATQSIAKKLKVNFVTFDQEEFKDALNVELQAEIKEGDILPEDELGERELEGIGRVTLAHINMFD